MVLSSSLVAICLGIAASSPAQAATNGAWAVTPAVTPGNTTPRPAFELVANPGQVITDRVTVSNVTTHPINFAIYAADGYNTAIGGAFALKLPVQRQVDVGAWAQLPVGALTVPGRTQATFPFTLTIPPNATPGDHAGGIVAENSAPTSQTQGGVHVNVLKGVGTRIYLRVNGPLQPSVGITDAASKSSIGPLSFATGSGRGSVHFNVLNTGNVSLNAVATVKATDIFGSTVKTYKPISLGPLLPGANITLSEPTIALPRAGVIRYHVEVTAPGVKANGGATGLIIPWVLVAILVLLIVAFVWWRARQRRNRRAAIRTAQLEQPVSEVQPV
jgi:hypothetical protein